jgi:hypothetical protein
LAETLVWPDEPSERQSIGSTLKFVVPTLATRAASAPD